MLPYSLRNLAWQFVVVTSLFSLPVRAADDDSFDVQAALRYLPSQVVGAIGFAVYFLISAGLLFRLVRNRDWWGLCLPIAGFVEALGFLLRIFIRQASLRKSLGYYIAMNLFIVLSPAAFLAFNYILYGRLIRICAGRKHSYIKPEIVGRTFVISDIVTFLVQASGGSLQVQDSTAKIGRDIFLIGIILQAVSFFVYTGLVICSQLSVRRMFNSEHRNPHDEAWYKVFYLLYFSSLFIIVRSIYRVIETAQGFDGYLLTHEWPFLAFDSIPLAIGISIYIIYWPGHYIPKASSKGQETHQMGTLHITSSSTV